jgi:broad specificity phosphatase PhoE
MAQVIPETGHTYVSLNLRDDVEPSQIHDPGITPGGITEVRLFTSLYVNLRHPTVIITSPLRRCLQTTMHAFSQLIDSGEVRAIANPDLIEVSNEPCDMGTPLDRLREEFPNIQFPEELFPDIWPRSGNVFPPKEHTIFADAPVALSRRAQQALLYIKNLEDTEIIIVTHGAFAHFLFNNWMGQPGDSESRGTQLENGEARPMTMPGKLLDGVGLETTGTWVHVGPLYPEEGSLLDTSAEVLDGPKDYGIFTAAILHGMR